MEHLPALGWSDVARQGDLVLLEESIDARFVGVDQRLDRLEQRMDRLEQRMDRLEQRMDRLEQRMDDLPLELARQMRTSIIACVASVTTATSAALAAGFA